eukprot:12565522-Heterocapsa_arctica.AAC.1
MGIHPRDIPKGGSPTHERQYNRTERVMPNVITTNSLATEPAVRGTLLKYPGSGPCITNGSNDSRSSKGGGLRSHHPDVCHY